MVHNQRRHRRELTKPGPLLDRLKAIVTTFADETYSPDQVYPADPVVFIEAVLGGQLWEMQKEIARSVWTNRYTAVATCHGTGKSWLAARLVLAWLHIHENSIALTTAPTGRQVEHILWRNINAAVRRAKGSLLGRPLTLRYDIGPDWYGMGFKPNDTDTDPAQGFHAEKLLVVIDEAAGTPEPLINGLQAAMTTEGSRMLMIGNPTSTAGPFYEAFNGDETLWNTFRIGWPDTPNSIAGETVMPWLITQRWVDERIKEFGLDHPYVQARVFAIFASALDTLIPLAHVEAAAHREPWEVPDGPAIAGLDVARYGMDSTVLCLAKGGWVQEYVEWRGMSTVESAQRALAEIALRMPACEELRVDEIGLGAGVVDNLDVMVRDQGLSLQVVPVNVGTSSSDPDKWTNARSEMWWGLAKLFRDGLIGGAFSTQAIAEMSDVRYRFDGRHSMPIIEPKDDYRKRAGHSPDHADATLLAMVDPPLSKDWIPGLLVMGGARVNWGVHVGRRR